MIIWKEDATIKEKFKLLSKGVNYGLLLLPSHTLQPIMRKVKWKMLLCIRGTNGYKGL
jgi:hypothetical protein